MTGTHFSWATLGPHTLPLQRGSAQRHSHPPLEQQYDFFIFPAAVGQSLFLTLQFDPNLLVQCTAKNERFLHLTSDCDYGASFSTKSPLTLPKQLKNPGNCIHVHLRNLEFPSLGDLNHMSGLPSWTPYSKHFCLCQRDFTEHHFGPLFF